MSTFDTMWVQICLLLVASSSLSEAAECLRSDVRQFPDDFLFGTATASYQVEGAWNEDGKSENIWDRLTHTDPDAIKDSSNGDVADDSYHHVDRDVEMMRELGLQFFRFSISWSRLLPSGFPDQINEAGVAYYNNLIDTMLQYNIEPMVTLYHWDLPQTLQDMGGWANPYVTDWYHDYAKVAFELFGDRVKFWITMNEPREVCHQGYGADTKAPRVNIPGIAEYMCAKNLLVAHAKAYHLYDEEYRPKYNGTIGITLSISWYEPLTEDDVQATEDYIQFDWGIYANPVFSENGDFPDVMKERIAEKSAAQGYARSRLPEFSKEEVDFVLGSSDFFGLNHYTTYMVYKNESTDTMFEVPSFYDDIGAQRFQPSYLEGSHAYWLKVVPQGMYKTLNKIKDLYNNPTVYITENGYASSTGLEDDARIMLYYTYLEATLDAINEGCDVRGYAAWSLMDNFEWMEGYSDRFGLYEVDYESENRTRTPRKSAFAYKQILSSRSLDCSYMPEDISTMTIDEGH